MPISNYVTMFYGARSEIFEKAAALRNNMTVAEKILWKKLKDRNLFPSKFRRQHPITSLLLIFIVTMQNWLSN
jgi:very-short-patch-repair endonuclease